MVGRVGAALIALGWITSAAAAQSPADLQEAARAFSNGQRAQLEGDYATAAGQFEAAHRRAPSPAALRSAIRNYRDAGSLPRAGTLAVEGRRLYPDDAEIRELEAGLVPDLMRARGRLDVACESPCTLAVDGALAASVPLPAVTLFLEPGTHRIAASFAGRGDVAREVELAAGESERLVLETPEAAAAPAVEPVPGPAPVAPTPEPEERGGLHPGIFYGAAGATALMLGVTIWSGLDTLDARDAYEANPTRAGYENGRDLERRTNALIATTGVLAVGTVVLGIVTRWGDDDDDTPDVALSVTPDGAYALVSGRFGSRE